MSTSSRLQRHRAGRLARSAASLAPLLLGAALASAACTGAIERPDRSQDRGARRGQPGSPTEPAGASPAKPIEPAPPRVWEPARSLSSFRKATARAASQHMQGDLQGEVLTNAEGSAYPELGPTRAVAPGAVIIEAHYKPDSQALVTLFVMEKKPTGVDAASGEWEYMIVEPSGAIVQRGREALCERCHAEAPSDHLFGVAH